MNRSCSSYCDDCRSDFMPEHFVIGFSNKTCPVNQSLKFGSQVCKISRRSQNYAIGFEHLLNAFVDDVLVIYTFLIHFFVAFPAGCTAVNSFSSDLHNFGFYSFLFKFCKDMLYKGSRISFLSRTSVKRDNFHFSIPPVDDLFSLFSILLIRSLSGFSLSSRQLRHSRLQSSSCCQAW